MRARTGYPGASGRGGASEHSRAALAKRRGSGYPPLGSIPLVEEVDELPFPAYDLVDVRKILDGAADGSTADAQVSVLFQQPGLSVQVHLLP